ncbi:hypothetical protein DZA25_11195 [Pseudomonas aeruginosa]|nr:hypothetical protein DZA25_11195 [Pseudomonas aeruginosa]TEH38466.1 hypothetical protein IPC1320_23315 [Pseudomonas aeruginosa]
MSREVFRVKFLSGFWERRRANGTPLVCIEERGSGAGEFSSVSRRVETNVINLSCSPAQGKPPEAASRHGRRAMTRPLPLNQAV